MSREVIEVELMSTTLVAAQFKRKRRQNHIYFMLFRSIVKHYYVPTDMPKKTNETNWVEKRDDNDGFPFQMRNS